MKDTSLRFRLLVGFVVASMLPLVAAAALSIPWFRSAIRQEAANTLNTNATVANSLLAERMRGYQTESLAISQSLAGSQADSARIVELLELQAATYKDSSAYVMWVDPSGSVRWASTPSQPAQVTWGDVQKAVESKAATSFVAIAPQETVLSFGLAKELELGVRETPGGSATEKEVSGAISIVAVAPLHSGGGRANGGVSHGAVVIVDVLKLDNAFVDSISSKVGGVATVFQNGVRVATTVKTDSGQRAVGTAISDKVRAASLVGGKDYRGEAPVVGRPHITAYDILRNPSGEIVGMLFVGLDKAPYSAAENRFAFAMGSLALVGTALAVLFGLITSRLMARPFVRVSDAAQQISTGDLTVEVPVAADFTEARTLGASFNTMTSGLRTLIGTTGSVASRLKGVSSEISQAAATEADAAAGQASAVAEATATLEELNRSFGAVAEGARRVLDIAEDSLEVAGGGRTAVENGAGNTERLAAGAQSVNEAAGQLAEVADDIGQVTYVIGSIAEQTKILALNAAIEAARAGQAGKGFGVVATEIRTLADSVSTSINRIDGLVRNIQQASKDLAMVSEAQVGLVGESVGDAIRTRDSFDAIYDRMDRTASAAREIATAASQQQAAAHAIVDVMQQVSQGVSNTASSARQLSEAASDVEREAGSLSSSLQGFRT